MNNVSIQPVEITDFKRLHEIEVQIFPSPCSMDLIIGDFQNNPYSRYFKLIYDDEIIGYVGVWVLMEDAQIVTIGIDPRYQGQGFGRYLLNFIINYLKEEGCQRITLEVRVNNIRAISLYHSFGFNEVAIRKQYYENGDDAYLMLLEFYNSDYDVRI